MRRGALITAAILSALVSAAARETPGGTSPLAPELNKSLAAIEAALGKLRGLPFKSEVATAELTHEGARDYIRKTLHTEYPGDRLAAEEEALRYFGLIAPDQDLERLYLDLMESQVAGLYDPPGKILYVVRGPLASTIALAHELAHALMDQHFDLGALEKKAKENDDRALALSSLIEGEATMVMTLWTVQSGGDPNLPDLTDVDPAEIMKASEAGMRGMPPFLRETLVFPYVSGMAWAGEVMRKGGGLKALDDYFRRPPESSEQILHPERSLAPRDLPSVIDAGLVASGIPAGARTVKRDAMGEFAIRFLLGGASSAEAREAASGWDGDAYLLGVEAGARFLSWVSVWDSEEDALQFAAAVTRWLEGRQRAAPAGAAPAHGAVRKGRVVVVTEGGGDGAGAARDRAAAILARVPAGIELR